ncbi:MAG: acyl-CoA thioesterase [Streptosporangiaceae bacterium]|nr:acyl-CoA thioesterase [Streptosporangiaceae bacterium]
MTPYFEHRHVVGLEETNLVGNVYFSHFMRWQGQCREMFLREHAPEVLTDLADGFKIFTVSCTCEYLAEVSAFEEISIRLYLKELTQTQIAFAFGYFRVDGPAERQVARGTQRVVCMRAAQGEIVPARVPESLRSALASYRLGDDG